MKIEFLRRIWADVLQGRNVDVYLTVLICFIVFALDIMEIVDLKVVTGAILAVLSLEAASLLTNRRTEQESKQSLETILKRQRQFRLSEVITSYSERMHEISGHLMQADEVWVLSRTCRMLWKDYQVELQVVARRDGLKLLFINPDDGALDMVAKSAIWWQADDGKRLKADVEHFVRRLKLVQEKLDLDKLEVRLIDYLPAWTLILINPRKDDGVIYVELATYRSHSRKHPGFLVKCCSDASLFYQFRDEFEQMWNDAQLAWEHDQAN